MLRNLYQERKPSPDALVFPSPKGKPLDDHNFSQRVWRSVLESVGVEYRHPYMLRHSYGSHAHKNGATPAEIAEQMGNSIRVCLDTYVKPTEKRKVFVEF
jgi:integrase